MRVINWPAKLDAKVEEWRSRAFQWGTSDCCQFVAEVAEAITGEDRRGLFPTYVDKDSALAILAEYGGLDAILTEAFGAPKHPSRAMRGDVVTVNGPEGLQAAVCLGQRCAAPGAAGIVFQHTRDALQAWSV